MATNVPIATLTSTGFVAPSESAILAGVQADQNDAFGGELSPNLETPQGQLAVSETAVIGRFNDLLLQYFNQVDPLYSSGRMQDAIGRLYFINRNPAEPTTVNATCVGLSGTVISTGSLALALDGNTYSCTTGGTIDSTGSITLPFACTATGPIECPANSLTTIYRAIPGWDSINNPSDGIVGSDVESRSDFEARRRQSVAGNAVGTLSAIRASVLSVPNVLDAYVTENTTGSAVTIGGVSVAAHSLYVAAAGGDLDAIAHAIWVKKNPGCGYTGTTTRTVLDSNSGYNIPYPSYSVSFTVPASLPIYIAVVIANTSAVPADATAQIQSAVVAAFNGLDGQPRAKIGSTTFAFRFAAGIQALGTWAQIISIKIGTAASPTGNDVTSNINQIPTIDPAHVTVALGTP